MTIKSGSIGMGAAEAASRARHRRRRHNRHVVGDRAVSVIQCGRQRLGLTLRPHGDEAQGARLDSPLIAANLPTQWVGVRERISIFSFMLGLVVLAIALLRAQRGDSACPCSTED
jgi:hypothetical protein